MSSKKNTTRAALAALVAAATLVSPFSAYAGEGGGGSGTGTGSGDGTAGGLGKITWVYKDNYGTPTRDNAIAAMQSAGVKNLGGTESNKAIDDAVNNANAECVARSQAAGQSDPQCRLVSVGFVHTPGSSGDWYTGANGSLTAKQWQDAWVSSGIPNNTYNYNGTDYKTSSPFNDGSTTINSLVRRETDKAPRAFIAIVLSQYEPAPGDYSLGISTQASGTVTQAGSTADVSDQITLSRNGSSISEDVTGRITLHWTGLDGTTRTASKQFTQNNGSTRSVSFGYRDLDGTWRRPCLRPWRRARRAPPRSGRPARPAPAFSVLKPCGTFLSSSVLQLQPALCALTGRRFRDAWGRRATETPVRIPACPRACPPNHGG